MHIGVVVPTLRGGGAQFAAVQWLRGLDALGHKATVYLTGDLQLPVEVPDRIVIRRCARRYKARLPLWLRWQVRQDRPDVILSLLTYTNVVSILALRCGRSRVPVAVSERTLASLAEARPRDRLVLSFARLLYRRASAAIAISHPVAAELISLFHVDPRRVFVVPNPVTDGPREQNKLGPSDSAQLHIVNVGRHEVDKDPGLFLKVVQALSEKGIDVRGTLVGDGTLRVVLEEQARAAALPVSFLGWRDAWWKAARGADCLVLTSRVEGFGNVLIEAAAVGIPAVASSRAIGVADAIVPGITGELVLTDDAEAFADGVLRAVGNGDLRGAAIGAWLDHFSVERSTELLVRALREAVGYELCPIRRSTAC